MSKLENLVKNLFVPVVLSGMLCIGVGCRDNNYRSVQFYDSGNNSNNNDDNKDDTNINSNNDCNDESNNSFDTGGINSFVPSYSSPQQTYDSLVYALKNNDLQASLNCFDPSSADREKLKKFDLIKLAEQIDEITFENEFLIAPGVTQVEYIAEDGRKLPMILYQELNFETKVYEWKIHVLL
jgi:hypothetical protein